MEETQTPSAPVTVQDLDALLQSMFDQRKKIEEMEALVTEQNKIFAAMKMKAVAYLTELGRDSYAYPGLGRIKLRDFWRFNLPPNDEAKAEFFTFLRERGLFDKYATVNAQSYNSFLNAEWEVAKEEGRGMEFKVPGVPEPKFFRDLSITKG